MHKSPEEIARELEDIARTERAGRRITSEGQSSGSRPPVVVPPEEPTGPEGPPPSREEERR